MMWVERGYYVRNGKLSSYEAEHTADYYQALRDRKAQRREEEKASKADVGFFDYTQLGEYISAFYKAGTSSDRTFYRNKIIEINKVYGMYLDDYTKNRIRPVLRAR